jgi:hypothetical protein
VAIAEIFPTSVFSAFHHLRHDTATTLILNLGNLLTFVNLDLLLLQLPSLE